MYAHQVIEGIEQIKKRNIPGSFKSAIRDWDALIPLIRKSEKFHFGDLSDLVKVMESDVGKPVFMDHTYMRLPFDHLWFDYNKNNGKNVNKIGIIVSKIEEIIWRCTFFEYELENKTWVPSPNSYLIFVGDIDTSINQYPGLQELVHNNKHMMDKKGTIHILPSYELTRDQAKTIYDYENVYFGVLQTSIKLLNCKNININKVKAPERLNKKRRISGKLELFDYHILNVFISSTVKHRESTDETDIKTHYRVHLCRGHFKKRNTGLFWWQPQVRGQNKKGIVMKEYKVIQN